MSTDHVEYELTIEPAELDYHGNCSAIDPDIDREQEEWIADQLDRGNEYAWCWARVTATFRGFEGDDSLGGISCRDRDEFDIAFLPEMRANALADLRRKLEEAADTAPAIRDARKRAKEARDALRDLPSDVQ